MTNPQEDKGTSNCSPTDGLMECLALVPYFIRPIAAFDGSCTVYIQNALLTSLLLLQLISGCFCSYPYLSSCCCLANSCIIYKVL